MDILTSVDKDIDMSPMKSLKHDFTKIGHNCNIQYSFKLYLIFYFLLSQGNTLLLLNLKKIPLKSRLVPSIFTRYFYFLKVQI